MALYFRHASVRPHQKELMGDMLGAITEGKIFMAHAPTGLGKTDAVLSAAITAAMEQKRSVFFLTPKISQHKIAIDAVRGIAEKHSLPIRAVDLVGRANCCIDEGLAGLDNESFQTACEKMREKKQCQFYTNARGYGRMEEARAEARFKAAMEGYGTGRSHHDVISMGRGHMACPYEWLMRLASSSDVIIADYYHIMVPHIRDIFLMKIKKRIEDSIIIVDEAHNLAARVRSSLSRGANTHMFARMAKEMRFIGLDAGPVEEEFRSWSAEQLGKSRERVVSMESFNEFIGRFGLAVDEAMDRLQSAGEAFVEATGRKSACLRLARFLAAWAMDDRGCVRILRGGGGQFFLSKRMLDPSPATKVLNESAASVLMSGSLLPMEMHRDVLGLYRPRTIMKSYPSPFDPGNVVNVITENITTRYSRRSDEEYSAIASKLDAIVAGTPGGTAVFFPSYGVMDRVLPRVMSRNLIVQKPGMRPHEVRDMLKEFKGGGVLCGVQGGSLSEGVDYCDGEIKTVVIVGVGLEEMNVESRALIDYYDEKFGRGWDYGYLYPGTIKALQAAGRARRKESDRVAIVYMDERFKWSKYNWILNRDERIILTREPERAVADFWECEDAIHGEVRAEKAR